MDNKFKAKLMVIVILPFLMVLPIANYMYSGSEESFKFRRKHLYNIDIFITPIQKKLFDYGISFNSNSAYIGKNNWLFLGDRYANNVTARRIGLTNNDLNKAGQQAEGLLAWNNYFKSKEVEAFFIMLGPDKASIYPEFLPRWAKSAERNKTDVIVDGLASKIIFDSRKPLLSEKNNFMSDFYYYTDTHWNFLGGWIAFNEFIKELNLRFPLVESIKFLTADNVLFEGVSNSGGNDLLNFLKIKDYLIVEQPVFEFDSTSKPIIKTNDYPLVKVFDGNNSKLLKISKNTNALNTKKVLWLRDSFGGAVAPFMHATFSEVLEVHYENTNSEKIELLVDDFKPNFIFFTIVERDLSNLPIGLSELPPLGMD